MSDRPRLPRFCRETREQLPALVAGELRGWPARAVRRHLRRCTDCRAEYDRQERLHAALVQLRGTAPEPPPGLLEDLLEVAHRRSLRQRLAVPTRGAVSGARPALSVTYLTVGAVASTGAGWALWRTARRLRRH